MSRKFFMLSAIVIMTMISIDLAHAGLINYDRRGTRGGAAAPATGGYRRPAPAAAAPAAPALAVPAWVKQSPRVTTADERRYDINRDGLLQTAEVKIYLRDVIDGVVQKGGFTVNSDILKEYDKNKDGVINSYELADIRKDVSN